MTDSSEESVQNRLNELLDEVDESGNHSVKPESYKQDVAPPVSMFFGFTLVGMICLGIGYWVGSSTTKMLQSPNPPSRDQLISAQQGWRAEGSGVFYRWCRGECHAPRLYGGGVSQVFEVQCVDRPCGDISMRFIVLNAKGEPIHEIPLKGTGLQGELRRFIIESEHQDAASIELSEFKAVARVPS